MLKALKVSNALVSSEFPHAFQKIDKSNGSSNVAFDGGGKRQFGLVYWGLTPQQQPGSYQGGEMMMMKSVIWWRKPEYPEETTDLRQVTTEKESCI